MIANTKWAFYSYTVQASDKNLTSMIIHNDTIFNSLVVTGYDSDSHSIIVSYRGTQETSITNWVEDAHFTKIEYYLNGCYRCWVHIGFYNTYNSTSISVWNEISNLTAQYPGA